MILDYTEILEDVTIFIYLIFLVTVTHTPVSLIGLLQLGNENTLIFSCIVQILARLLLITLVSIIKTHKTLGHKTRYFLIEVSVIPIVYTITLIISFLYHDIAVLILIPISITNISNIENKLPKAL